MKDLKIISKNLIKRVKKEELRSVHSHIKEDMCLAKMLNKYKHVKNKKIFKFFYSKTNYLFVISYKRLVFDKINRNFTV